MSTVKAARLGPIEGRAEEMMHISSFAIAKKGNELLLVKRIRPEFTAGKWTLPSSIINYGEHPEAAIKRIVREQVGTEPKNIRLLDIQSYGDKHWDLCFVYEVTVDSVGNVSQDVEKAEYFDRGKLPPEFRAGHAEVLESLKSKI
jgi:ADP-ribose pyrophosphatase YjhB (NUDIX family)